MADPYVLAKKVASQFLVEFASGQIEQADIAREVDAACDMIQLRTKDTIDALQRARMRREMETDFSSIVGKARALHDDDQKAHVDWLPYLESQTADWPFWHRYVAYLEGRRSPRSMAELDDSTRLVLSLLENPDREGTWDRRGLVVGHVQSGKTEHYTGVINKAADSGYKLIIVLAGMLDSLRSQTQIRLEEGFLGWETGAEEGSPITGVGFVRPGLRADTITNRLDKGDFKKQVAESFRVSVGKRPLLFVIKKNVSVLRNLVKWVRTLPSSVDSETGRIFIEDIPILVIDDEADHASVDTRKGPVDDYGNPDPEHDPAATNRLIRQLLHAFDKSAYVGYTATPFANIFIHDKAQTIEEGLDLFPRSFIVSLEAPSNYVGPARVFGLEQEDTTGREAVRPLRLTRQNEDGNAWIPPIHKPEWTPRYLDEAAIPPTLKESIHAFILSGAAKTARGLGREHHSMLIHVTRFTEVQHKIYGQVRDYLAQIRRPLRRGVGAGDNLVLEQLQTLWERDFEPTTAHVIAVLEGTDATITPLSWEDIRPHIIPVLEQIEIREINGKARDALEYEENKERGLKVIAIGGNKLSRGLTLEGLCVSYFLRTSRMYDSLMQMGRWFGYRPGYLDLCRLYLPAQLKQAFIHITEASEDLRREFEVMAAVKATPEEYGLKVLWHPTLLVTSPNKMRASGMKSLSFDGTSSETVVFYPDAESTLRNLEATESLIKRLPKPSRYGGANSAQREGLASLIWENVSPSEVITFLREYRTHREASKVKSSVLAEYISHQVGLDELTHWTVVLVSSGTGRTDSVADVEVGLVERTTGGGRSGDRLAIKRLVSPSDEALDLTDEERLKAKELARTRRGESGESALGGIDIRNARTAKRGLLLLYPLDPTQVGEDELGLKCRADDTSHPLMGFAISFPASTTAVKRKYRINRIYTRNEEPDE